jgi:hypothetical protein
MEWNAILLLGAYHGINPGMGWLFAVALGMQQGSARGVWRSLLPIVLGHTIAVGVVLLAAGLLQMVVPLEMLKVGVAALLVAFGGYRLVRHRHPRFGGMQMSLRELTVWSFLMASAHGAGLMVLPFVMEMSHPVSAAGGHPASHVLASGASVSWFGAMALGVHTLAYFVAMTLAAWVVYRKLGLALLRTAWLNLDWVWAVALVATGLLVLLS